MANLSRTGWPAHATLWSLCSALILTAFGCVGQDQRDAVFGLDGVGDGEQLIGVAGIGGDPVSAALLSCEIVAYLSDGSPAPSILETVDPIDVTIGSTVHWDGAPVASSGIDENVFSDALYTWQIDDQVRVGPADTHSTRSFRLFDPGAHSVSLLIDVGGATIQCIAPSTQTETLQVVAAPRLSGFVTDQTGAAMAGVTVSLTGGQVAQTDTAGAFEVYVTLGWSGTVTVSHPGFLFDPLEWSLSNVLHHVSLSVVGTPGVGCADGLFCNGQESYDGDGNCHPGADPCPTMSCNETTDTCYDIDTCLANIDAGMQGGAIAGCPAFGPPTLCITPTPESPDVQGTRDAFAIAALAADCVCLPDPTDWWHAEQKAYADSSQYQDAQWERYLLDEHSLDVFVQIDAFRPHRWGETATPALLQGGSFGDPVIRRAFTADAVERVTAYAPTYVCLGMEINTYYEEHPEDFDNFVSLFKETRREIKQLNPNVVVFVSFQYEQLQAFSLGDSVVASREPRWELIDRFEPDQDAVGISSYPIVSWGPPRFGPPSELPEDYYKRLREHTSKPIIFAELGWPSDPAFGGTPEAQAEFLRRFPSLIEGLDVPMVNWNFLYDVTGYGPVFDSMGLFDFAGEPKPGWTSLNEWPRAPRRSG